MDRIVAASMSGLATNGRLTGHRHDDALVARAVRVDQHPSRGPFVRAPSTRPSIPEDPSPPTHGLNMVADRWMLNGRVCETLDVMYEHLLVSSDGPFTTITLNRPEKRNALALNLMLEVTEAFRQVGKSEATGVILAASGPVFSAGHNFGDMAGASLDEARELFTVCTAMMDTVQSIPNRWSPRCTPSPPRPDANWLRRATWRLRPTPPGSPCPVARAACSATPRWSPCLATSDASGRWRWR